MKVMDKIRSHAEDSHNSDLEQSRETGGVTDFIQETSHEPEPEQERAEDGELGEALRDVARSRTILSLLFIVSALTTSFVVASHFTKQEVVKYQDAFLNDVATMKEHIGIREGQNLNFLSSLARSLTTQAQYALASTSNTTWPYFLSPDFALQGHDALGILNSSKILYAPLVSTQEQAAWEAWTVEAMVNSPPSSPYIFQVDSATGEKVPEGSQSTDTDVYVPVTGVFPHDPQEVMFNLASVPGVREAIGHIVATQEAVMLPWEGNNVSSILPSTAIDKDYNDLGIEEKEPSTLLLVPIFSSFQPSSEARTVVGLMGVPFLFKSYFTSTFSGDTEGLLAVVNSSCPEMRTTDNMVMNGFTYTYEVNQNRAVFKGRGDLHLDYYTSERQTASLVSVLEEAGLSTSADGTHLSASFCPYDVSFYPSARFHNHHMTKSPIKMTISVVLIFSCTLLIFLLFGAFTSRRLELMGRRTAHMRKLYNKLFPKEVQERMFKADGDPNEEARDPLLRLKALVNKEKEKVTPICDLWPNATVLFADISGFTAWSSQ